MNHGARAPAGLVGVNGTGKALLHGGGNGRTGETADGSFSSERAFKDHAESAGDRGGVHYQNDDHAHDIEDAHERDEIAGDLTDFFHAAHADSQNTDEEQRAGNKIGNTESGADCLRDGVVLDGDEEIHENAEAEENGEDLPALPAALLTEAAFHIIRWATGISTVRIGAAVINGERDLSHFDNHTDQGGDPQPEECTRAAGGNRRADAGNVGNADAAADRDGNRLERSETVFAVLELRILFERVADDQA